MLLSSTGRQEGTQRLNTALGCLRQVPREEPSMAQYTVWSDQNSLSTGAILFHR